MIINKKNPRSSMVKVIAETMFIPVLVYIMKTLAGIRETLLFSDVQRQSLNVLLVRLFVAKILFSIRTIERKVDTK